jgi:hypothetical protein
MFHLYQDPTCHAVPLPILLSLVVYLRLVWLHHHSSYPLLPHPTRHCQSMNENRSLSHSLASLHFATSVTTHKEVKGPVTCGVNGDKGEEMMGLCLAHGAHREDIITYKVLTIASSSAIPFYQTSSVSLVSDRCKHQHCLSTGSCGVPRCSRLSKQQNVDIF